MDGTISGTNLYTMWVIFFGSGWGKGTHLGQIQWVENQAQASFWTLVMCHNFPVPFGTKACGCRRLALFPNFIGSYKFHSSYQKFDCFLREAPQCCIISELINWFVFGGEYKYAIIACLLSSGWIHIQYYINGTFPVRITRRLYMKNSAVFEAGTLFTEYGAYIWLKAVDQRTNLMLVQLIIS